MRISREKVNKLAHAVADALAETDSVDFIEDRNTIRQESRRVLELLMAEEAKIDAAARQKIESQRRTILEGSQEWDILYRKYYNEEVKKLFIYPAAPGLRVINRKIRPHRNATAFCRLGNLQLPLSQCCLLYTSDAADEEDSVDLGGRR